LLSSTDLCPWIWTAGTTGNCPMQTGVCCHPNCVMLKRLVQGHFE
jgi:hypothetical protein